MKVKKTKDKEENVKITFIPETEEEKIIMGTLRHHFFWGLPEKGTYPEYGGITTEETPHGVYVASLSLKFKLFK